MNEKFNFPTQFQNTSHETMFEIMFPLLKRQVTFGTGKGGLKKWGSKKYTLDFYDPFKKLAFEIDGKSHQTYYSQIKDRLRDLFFLDEKGIKTYRLSDEKGIKTYRLSNEFVEKAFYEYVRKEAQKNAKSNAKVFQLFFGR